MKHLMRAKHLTIMLTDIKGFTSRTSAQSRAKTAALLKTHEELLLPVIAKFSGTLVKSIGDAFLATFESPTDAVLCGLAIQDVLTAHNAACKPDEKIEIRVALNSGEVALAEDGDIYGEAVNAAARLEGIVEAGEVFITEAVYLAMNRNEAGFEDKGYHSFRGIPEKIRVFKVFGYSEAGGPGKRPDNAAELVAVTAQPVSETDRAEAADCFEKGLKEYFNELNFAKAINLMKEASETDPFFLDAYFLYAIFSKTVGDEVAVLSVLNKLKALRPSVTEQRSLSKIDIISARLEHDPDCDRMAEKFLRRYPGDVLAFFVLFFSAGSDNSRTQEAAKALRRAYPFIEDIVPLHTLAEYEYYRHGNVDSAIAIFEGLIKRKPENVNLRLGLLRILLHTGKLIAASAQLESALKISPTNENLQRFAGELAFLKNDIGDWFTHMSKLLTLTQHSDSHNSGLYYQLYKAAFAAGKEADAEKHLAMAHDLGPEWGWQSAEETSSSMERFKLKDGLFDLSPAVLAGLGKRIVDWNYSKWLYNRLPDSSGVVIDLYVFKNSPAVRHVKIWTQYVTRLGRTAKGSVSVESIPNSAFFNENGDIIKCRFSEVSLLWGQRMGELTYPAPLQRHAIEFLAAEMGVSESNGETLFRVENLNMTRGMHGFIFLLPADFSLESLSRKPDETVSVEDGKLVFYSQFLYAFQKFRLDIPLKNQD